MVFFKIVITGDTVVLCIICTLLNNDIQKLFAKCPSLLFLRLNTTYDQLLKGIVHNLFFLFVCFSYCIVVRCSCFGYLLIM